MFFHTCIERMIFTAYALVVLGCDAADELEGPDAEMSHEDADLLAEPDDEADLDEAGAIDESGLDITNVPDTALGGCNDVFDISVSGGRAVWTLTCVGNEIYMTGKVWDTGPDFKCAHMKGVFNNATPKWAHACGVGTSTPFSWKGSGNIANGYLSVT